MPFHCHALSVLSQGLFPVLPLQSATNFFLRSQSPLFSESHFRQGEHTFSLPRKRLFLPIQKFPQDSTLPIPAPSVQGAPGLFCCLKSKKSSQYHYTRL